MYIYIYIHNSQIKIKKQINKISLWFFFFPLQMNFTNVLTISKKPKDSRP
jgi:hypothetical protein